MITPAYLSDVLPERVSQQNEHGSRNRNDIQSIRCHSELYSHIYSFLPDTIRQWNSLPYETINNEEILRRYYIQQT